MNISSRKYSILYLLFNVMSLYIHMNMGKYNAPIKNLLHGGVRQRRLPALTDIGYCIWDSVTSGWWQASYSCPVSLCPHTHSATLSTLTCIDIATHGLPLSITLVCVANVLTPRFLQMLRGGQRKDDDKVRIEWAAATQRADCFFRVGTLSLNVISWLLMGVYCTAVRVEAAASWRWSRRVQNTSDWSDSVGRERGSFSSPPFTQESFTASSVVVCKLPSLLIIKSN